MASIKYCILVSVVLSWRFSTLASPCSENCTSDNNETLCEACSYNVTIKEGINLYRETVCCVNNVQYSKWTQNFANKTVTNVSVRFGNVYNATSVHFDFPLLDTYSLSISNNSLNEIEINVKTQNLREIDLSCNKLQSIAKGLFNNFLSLRKLTLRNNELIYIMEGSFSGLSKLESLDLSVNNLTVLTNIFTPLKNLQHLNLSRNNIEFIHENYFNNWLLQHLDVSHNNLKKVAPGALQLLPNLARLLLTDNPHLGITQLDTQMLVGTGRRLQQIDASRTGLQQVPEAFTHSVRFLSLAGNWIVAVRCGDLDSYPLLQSLDFSDNEILSVEEDSLGRLEMLLFLNFNDNLLTLVPKSLPDELKYLSINNNLIKNLTAHDLKNLPNLRILLLKNNKIRYIHDHVFDDLLSLEMLDLSHNPIQMLSPNTFDGPLSLRDLRLCYLNLSVPEKDGSFPMSSPESIQMLHLQSSPGLARQLLADSAALAAFSHLQYLDLRMNNLTEIRNDLLFYLAQLKTLRLQGNIINCSAQFWLKDWMHWNKSISNGESCYYSSSEAKYEINKYNCTFPETFTISESLPPVNLYSTEMINKLLRYYGYLNKTDKPAFYKPQDKDSYKNKGNLTLKKNEYTKEKITQQVLNTLNSTLSKDAKVISVNNKLFFNETTLTNKLLEDSKDLNDQYNIEHRLLDIDPNLTLSSQTSKIEYYDEILQIRRNNRSGKRLNTPINIKKLNDSENKTQNLPKNTVSKMPFIEHEKDNTDKSDANFDDKTQFSPYQSTHRYYVEYVGMAAVCSLIVIALILWVSFRLRYRRRRRSAPAQEALDQIEVSNISGGVLW